MADRPADGPRSGEAAAGGGGAFAAGADRGAAGDVWSRSGSVSEKPWKPNRRSFHAGERLEGVQFVGRRGREPGPLVKPIPGENSPATCTPHSAPPNHS